MKEVLVNGIFSQIRFYDVYLSPGIQYKLISLGTIEAQKFSIELFKSGIKVIDSEMQEVCLIKTYDKTSYILDFAIFTKKITVKIKSALSIALKSFYIPFQNHIS